MSNLDFDDADLEGGEEEKSSKDPFDDEPFDPGVEADEEEEPKKFVQQLTGKLSQTLRNYSDEEGVDPDLEQYVINMVLDASHPDELKDDERQEIIDRLQSDNDDEPELKDDGGGEEDNEEQPDEEDSEERDEDEESIEDELDDDISNNGGEQK